jgi:hypothetical protein
VLILGLEKGILKISFPNYIYSAESTTLLPGSGMKATMTD